MQTTIHDDFVNASGTLALEDRDFTEWHNGISHYGFWAVVVDNPDWVKLFYDAQVHVAPFVLPGYQRAPHITVAACGLLDQRHFTTELLDVQYDRLMVADFHSFSLGTTFLNSFTSSPHLNVLESEELHNIRKMITGISEEDAASEYRPHVTLGLYRDVFDTVEIADHLTSFQYPTVEPMMVTSICFCTYETCDIQGPFQIVRKVLFK